MATFVNNVGVGFFLAGVLQPLLALLREGARFGLPEFLATLLLGGAGVILGFVAQIIARRLED